jgi:dolichol-phosphate mannosyltransferase
VETLEQVGGPFEIMIVDDGSTDGTSPLLDTLTANDPRVKSISFRRNHGQTAAIMAGIEHTMGDVLILMDGDQQNDPSDIPRLLEKLDEGYDVVSGWRKDRKDPFLTRVLPSRIANCFISWFSGVLLHDTGCTLKAYRRGALKEMRLYGEMHRFIPILVNWHGGRISEITVNHHARIHGRSNYGVDRVVKVVLDLLVIKFLNQFETRPIHVFGIFGIGCMAASFLAGLFALYLKFYEGMSFIVTPLPLLVVLLFLTGVLSVLMGLLAEMLVRIFYETSHKPIYFIKSTRNLKAEAER